MYSKCCINTGKYFLKFSSDVILWGAVVRCRVELYACQAHQWPEGDHLDDALQSEECSEDDVQVLQHVLVRLRGIMELQDKAPNNTLSFPPSWVPLTQSIWGKVRLESPIIGHSPKKNVMKKRRKYSKGEGLQMTLKYERVVVCDHGNKTGFNIL